MPWLAAVVFCVSLHPAIAPAPDLDGDGTPESFEEVPDSCGTGGCTYRVYLSSPKPRFIGVVEGHWPFEVRARRHGMPDLITTWWLGCCDTIVSRYRFQHGRYREISQRRVAVP